MQAPRIVNDGNREYKQIVAYSIEKEFEQKDWYGLKINTGESDSLEYLASNNINALGFAINYVVLCNYENEELSFMHLMLKKVSGWSIGHIDSTIISKRIPFIDVDNTNLYALMTSEVGPRLKCLFVFDFLHKSIDVHDQNNINLDTNIFISFRNLAKNINITVDEDSVFTRFRVRGNDDLLLNDWNLNSDIITDLSYFLCEPYMSEQLAEKYKNWDAQREYLRVLCANYAVQQADIQEKIDKLKYTVPSDPCYWKNWDNMNEEGLRTNLAYYNSLLRNLQISVDDRDENIKYKDPSDHSTYVPVSFNDGTVDHEYYLNRLFAVQNEFSGYYTYLEIVAYILPYILQALRNLELPEDQQVKYGDEAEENWNLYGIVELEAKRKSYELDKLPALLAYKEDWKDLTDEEKIMYVNEEGYNTQGHNSYLHIKEMIGDENTEGTIKYRLKILKEQLEKYEAEYEDITNKRIAAVACGQIDAYQEYLKGNISSIPDGTTLYKFTDDEVALIKTLYVETDYTNSNILTTSADTVQMIFNIEKDLYEDSIDMLSEASQPQYKVNVELDNLLRLNEFKDWHDDFKLLNFIRLGIRDDYSIKLRVVGFEWNPCEITPNLSIEFSNMISSRRGRTDLEDLIDTQNTRAQKNSISIGTGNSRTDQEYIASLIQVLMSNSIFTRGIADLASDQTPENLDIDTVNGLIDDYFANKRIRFNNVAITDDNYETISSGLSPDTVAQKVMGAKNEYIVQLGNEIVKQSDKAIEDKINNTKINVKNLTGDTDDFEDVFEDYLAASVVVSKIIEADSADIKELISEYISVERLSADELVAKILTADSASIATLQSSLITSDIINTRILDADEATIDFLSSQIITADNAVIQNVVADTISATDISVERITGDEGSFTNFFVEHMNVGDIFGENAQFSQLVSNSITTTDITAKLANIDQANVNVLFANNAFTQNLQTISSTAVNSIVTDAYIYNAVANKISVGELAAGDIVLSNNMRILSDNGMLVMNGNALQIIGEDSNGDDYVGIQLGYDTNNAPSLILRNEDGNIVLSPSGITQDAIADQLIVNNMIQEGTITKNRLSFSVVEANEHGGVDITNVYDGSGNNFGVEYTSFKNNTTEAIDEINNQKMYRAEIVSNNGNIFKNGNISCTLSCKVYSWDSDITDEINAANFKWTKINNDGTQDTVWNTIHFGGSKSITITPSDVYIRGTFVCTVTLPDGDNISSST